MSGLNQASWYKSDPGSKAWWGEWQDVRYCPYFQLLESHLEQVATVLSFLQLGLQITNPDKKVLKNRKKQTKTTKTKQKETRKWQKKLTLIIFYKAKLVRKIFYRNKARKDLLLTLLVLSC